MKNVTKNVTNAMKNVPKNVTNAVKNVTNIIKKILRMMLRITLGNTVMKMMCPEKKIRIIL